MTSRAYLLTHPTTSRLLTLPSSTLVLSHVTFKRQPRLFGVDALDVDSPPKRIVRSLEEVPIRSFSSVKAVKKPEVAE